MKRLTALLLALFAFSAEAQTVTPGTAAGPAVGRIDATAGTLSGVGKQTMSSDAASRDTVLGGANAYPRAATNTTGGNAKVCAGIGRRLFTIVDYSLIDGGADSVTVVVNGTSTSKTATTHWAAATSNAVTAANLATALNTISGITAVATGASVYVTPAATTCTLTISTNMDAGEGTATSGTDGVITLGGAVAPPTLSAPLPASQGGTGIANNDAATFTRSGNHALTVTTTGTANLAIGTGGTLGTAAYTAATAYATSAQGTTADNALPKAGGTMTGDLLFTDNLYDIGASAATRPRDMYLSRTLRAATSAIIGGATAINASVHSVIANAADDQTGRPVGYGFGTAGVYFQTLTNTKTGVAGATVIFQGVETRALWCKVNGNDGTNYFADLIVTGYGAASAGVINSFNEEGSPAVRTYSKSANSGNLSLAMASGTYAIVIVCDVVASR